MAKNTWARLIWLISLIREQNGITFEEISRRWERSYLGNGEALSKRTFHNHKQEIAEQFGIDIVCDRQHRYYIERGEMGKGSEFRSWLLSTLQTSICIQEASQLRHRILVESCPIVGSEYIETIMQAMTVGCVLELSYQSYWTPPRDYRLIPYALKHYDKRWYLLAQDVQANRLKTFALDRLCDVKQSEERGEMPEDFNPQEYFASSFGIMVDESYDVERVRLRVYGVRQKYLQTQALHPSQKLIEQTEEWSEYELRLRADIDFQQELLRYSDEVEVISPEWLRKDISQALKRALAHYD